VGVAAGRTEQALARRGIDVHAVAMDAVFAGVLRANGINAVEGTLAEALAKLPAREFDAILMADVLHLVETPVEWLRAVRPLLSAEGQLVVRVHNTGERSSWIRDWCRRPLFPNFARTGVQAVSASHLRRWCIESGFIVTKIVPSMPSGRRKRLGWFGANFFSRLFASSFIVTARRAE
jgi:2-polyprenyl-3-methyl-5-hydroxy-6-metoxy-1,4-benzoquinol methylase